MKTAYRSPWAPYVPSADHPWDLRKAAHLHRRAGCSATRGDLLRDLDAGPAASVDRLLSPRVSTEERDAADAVHQAAASTGDVDLLKAGWLNRIVHGSDPLREKTTLFWHNHFAPAVHHDEPGFRYALNEDAMATEKLAEGIRAFAADAAKLDALIAQARA